MTKEELQIIRNLSMGKPIDYIGDNQHVFYSHGDNHTCIMDDTNSIAHFVRTTQSVRSVNPIEVVSCAYEHIQYSIFGLSSKEELEQFLQQFPALVTAEQIEEILAKFKF